MSTTHLAVTILAGGAAGALISLLFGVRVRFWSKYSDLEKWVFDNPFLYPLWDQAADPSTPEGLERFNSSYYKWEGPQAYMDSLNERQRRKALVFLEMWGDFIVESNSWIWRIFLGRHSAELTNSAKKVAILFDLFPGSSEYRANFLGLPKSKVPDGRNGYTYSEKSLKALKLY